MKGMCKMEEKKYTLRNPNADDIFLMFRILSKVGIKNIKGCFESDEVRAAMRLATMNDADGELSNIGIIVAIDVAGVIMEHLDGAKNDIYAFLSRLSGMKVEEIAQMNPGDFAGMIIDTVKLEGFRDFFMRVTGLFK